MIQVSDSEFEFDTSSCIRSSGFIVVRITSNLEDEEEIPLERKKGSSLRKLLSGRSKGSMSKEPRALSFLLLLLILLLLLLLLLPPLHLPI